MGTPVRVTVDQEAGGVSSPVTDNVPELRTDSLWLRPEDSIATLALPLGSVANLPRIRARGLPPSETRAGAHFCTLGRQHRRQLCPDGGPRKARLLPHRAPPGCHPVAPSVMWRVARCHAAWANEAMLNRPRLFVVCFPKRPSAPAAPPPPHPYHRGVMRTAEAVMIGLLIALLLLPSAGLTQESPRGRSAELRPGVLVRTHAPSVQAVPVVGSFLHLTSDTLSLQVDTGARASIRHIPFDAIERLEVAGGRKRLLSGVLGAATGAVVLGGVAALDQRGAREQCRPECQVLDLEIGVQVVLGAAMGGGLGAAVFAPRRWQPLPGANGTR